MASLERSRKSDVLDLFTKLIIITVVALFSATCFLWLKPISDCGKLARKLCLVNALGWVLLLLLSGRGHPPPFLFPALLFWLINLPLLPATAIALWLCRQGHDEPAPYLAVAAAYVVMNAVVLFILPLVWLVVAASR